VILGKTGCFWLSGVSGHLGWFGPCKGPCEAFHGDGMYLRYSQEVTWNLHLLHGQQSITHSLQSLPNVSFVFRNVVGIDENASNICDNHVDHNPWNVIHKSLKSCWSISKPFRIQPLKEHNGQKAVFHSSPGAPEEMVCMARGWFWCRLCLSLVCLRGQKWAEVGYRLSGRFSWGSESRCKSRSHLSSGWKEPEPHGRSKRDGWTL